jgi:hypothetical protein
MGRKRKPYKKSESWKTNPPVCADCGVIVSRRGVKRCMKCQSEHKRGSNNPLWRGGGTILICNYCGKEFNRSDSEIRGQKYNYCSKKCEGLHRREVTPHGEEHWNYTNGLTPMFNQIRLLAHYKDWRKSVFERDNYTCQCCGDQGYIQAHHIKSVKDILMENNITNTKEAKECSELWEVENGITFCIKCHEETHLNERRIA